MSIVIFFFAVIIVVAIMIPIAIYDTNREIKNGTYDDGLTPAQRMGFASKPKKKPKRKRIDYYKILRSNESDEYNLFKDTYD